LTFFYLNTRWILFFSLCYHASLQMWNEIPS
jgi:hypothetical protein